MDNPYQRDENFSLDKTQSCSLYHVSFDSSVGRIYKIGITSRDVYTRFASDWNKLNMRLEWLVEYETGLEAYTKEQYLLRKYNSKLVNTGLLINGNTETLSVYIDKKELE